MAKNGNVHPSRIFKTPENLEEAFIEYKKDLKEQAKEWLKVQYVGKDAVRVTDAQKVPMTMEGFERFCYNNYGCVNHYFDNKEGYYEDFGTICSRIKREIRENQIIGGLLNFYNPSITQRLNSLSDNTNINATVDDKTFDITKILDKEALNKLANAAGIEPNED